MTSHSNDRRSFLKFALATTATGCFRPQSVGADQTHSTPPLHIACNEYPWGIGAVDNAVRPLRSWAVDNDYIPHGSVLYAPFWDGMQMPAIDDLGGFTHDGCFRADDHDPNRVIGNHYDFYAGTRKMALALDEIAPNGEFALVDVYLHAQQCNYLLPW